MRQEIVLAIVFFVGVSIVAGVHLSSSDGFSRADGVEAYSVPGKPRMTVPVAIELSDELAPALLLVVYEAFGKTQEDEIYDTLAQVSDGAALEYLYLDRVGAMAGGGLHEGDQTIHEIKMLDSVVTSEDSTLTIDATWQVIGTVGHAEHLHVRGNTYSADLSISPIDGAWRITDFALREVIRDKAGEMFEVSEGSHDD